MSSEELREKVAFAIAAKDGAFNAADAAIAIALEEAAKTAKEVLFFKSCCCSFEVEEAIRALIPSEEPPGAF